MDADSRRAQILSLIRQQPSPLSASSLAQALNVSRQVVVGDVALLRAQGIEIIATARGYIIPASRDIGQYMGKVACQHAPEDTRAELYAMVDLEAVVLSVIVEHEVYGEIAANLNLSTREDVDMFIRKVEGAQVKLLSELTMGVHLHALACRDHAHFVTVREALNQKGYLFAHVDQG